MTLLYPYLVAIVGITLLMTIWVVVQLGWRRAFPRVGTDEDVLAARSDCHGCDRNGNCQNQLTGGLRCD